MILPLMAAGGSRGGVTAKLLLSSCHSDNTQSGTHLQHLSFIISTGLLLSLQRPFVKAVARQEQTKQIHFSLFFLSSIKERCRPNNLLGPARARNDQYSDAHFFLLHAPTTYYTLI